MNDGEAHVEADRSLQVFDLNLEVKRAKVSLDGLNLNECARLTDDVLSQRMIDKWIVLDLLCGRCSSTA